MLKCTWNLSNIQNHCNPPFSVIQSSLAALGVMLDFSYDGGSISVFMEVPEPEDPTPQESNGIQVMPETGVDNEESPCQLEENVSHPHKRGRPSCLPVNDLTLNHVIHMRCENIPVDEIAKEIGVSKRTFYRRWSALKPDTPHDTPFSMW